jgi:hypothetical protein
MTMNQAIAMSFPLLTAAMVGITGLGVVRWVDRNREADNAKQRSSRDLAGSDQELEVIELLAAARGLIEKAQHQIQQRLTERLQV